MVNYNLRACVLIFVVILPLVNHSLHDTTFAILLMLLLNAASRDALSLTGTILACPLEILQPVTSLGIVLGWDMVSTIPFTPFAHSA